MRRSDPTATRRVARHHRRCGRSIVRELCQTRDSCRHPQSCRRCPRAPDATPTTTALIWQDESLTWAELDARVDAYARGLLALELPPATAPGPGRDRAAEPRSSSPSSTSRRCGPVWSRCRSTRLHRARAGPAAGRLGRVGAGRHRRRARVRCRAAPALARVPAGFGEPRRRRRPLAASPTPAADRSRALAAAMTWPSCSTPRAPRGGPKGAMLSPPRAAGQPRAAGGDRRRRRSARTTWCCWRSRSSTRTGSTPGSARSPTTARPGCWSSASTRPTRSPADRRRTG